MTLLDENFDADAILRDPFDENTTGSEEEKEGVEELELGNPSRLNEMDSWNDDDEGGNSFFAAESE